MEQIFVWVASVPPGPETLCLVQSSFFLFLPLSFFFFSLEGEKHLDCFQALKTEPPLKPSELAAERCVRRILKEQRPPRATQIQFPPYWLPKTKEFQRKSGQDLTPSQRCCCCCCCCAVDERWYGWGVVCRRSVEKTTSIRPTHCGTILYIHSLRVGINPLPNKISVEVFVIADTHTHAHKTTNTLQQRAGPLLTRIMLCVAI